MKIYLVSREVNCHTLSICSYPACNPVGLRGHLQTAVPPLIPSSRITALPKRKLSTHSPSASASAGSTASSISPTVADGNHNSNMGVIYRPVTSSGAAQSLSKTETTSMYMPSDCDKATLYSSTDSNTATLYGVPAPQLEVFFEVAESQSRDLQGNPTDPGPKSFPVTVQHPLVTTTNSNQQNPSLQTHNFTKQEDQTSKGQCATVVSNSKPCVSLGEKTIVYKIDKKKKINK